MIIKKIWLAVFLTLSCLASASAQSKPEWVDRPSAAYPDPLYVSAVGAGYDRNAAERNALAALTAFFKQSVTSRVSISDRERQAGGMSYSVSDMSQSIETSAALDKLMGAEIKETWNDTANRVWYAAAVMEKKSCAALYAAELDKAVRDVKSLIAMPGGVTFESIAKCKKAYALTVDADTYTLMLSMLDGEDRRVEMSDLVSEINAAMEAAKAIPVDVRVSGDSNGRIEAAFAKALVAEGFRTGGSNSRFVVKAAFSTAAAPKTAYFNTRYTVDAALVDTAAGAELFTFNIANRESHPAGQESADNRALIAAEKKITDDFPASLREYLEAKLGLLH
jgi:hypothetical protein